MNSGLPAGYASIRFYDGDSPSTLEQAGLEVLHLEGGHLREPYAANSARMFVIARRATASAGSASRLEPAGDPRHSDLL